MKPLTQGWQALSARLSARERAAVALAAWAVGLGLLWMLGIAPAWKALSGAPERHQALDAQLARMQALGAQAGEIRQGGAGQVPVREVAIGLIQRTARELGQGSVAVAGNQVNLRFDGARPDALARSLDQMRRGARVSAVRAELKRQDDGWHGSITLSGPGLGD